MAAYLGLRVDRIPANVVPWQLPRPRVKLNTAAGLRACELLELQHRKERRGLKAKKGSDNF